MTEVGSDECSYVQCVSNEHGLTNTSYNSHLIVTIMYVLALLVCYQLVLNCEVVSVPYDPVCSNHTENTRACYEENLHARADVLRDGDELFERRIRSE
jgi:hypothetical protein